MDNVQLWKIEFIDFDGLNKYVIFQSETKEGAERQFDELIKYRCLQN